jgi:hypothetical protein
MIFRMLLCAALFCLTASDSLGDVLFTNPITGANPNTSNPYTNGQTVISGITVSGIGRGIGINGNSANDRYNANSWNTPTLDVDAYFDFTLTPSVGNLISFESFVYTGQASGTGPNSFSFRSSTDSFTADIGTPTVTGATISLAGSQFQNLSSATTFRLYGWGASASAGTFSVNEFTFNGSVSAVPEPSSIALLSLVGIGGFALRRLRKGRAG